MNPHKLYKKTSQIMENFVNIDKKKNDFFFSLIYICTLAGKIKGTFNSTSTEFNLSFVANCEIMEL